MPDLPKNKSTQNAIFKMCICFMQYILVFKSYSYPAYSYVLPKEPSDKRMSP